MQTVTLNNGVTMPIIGFGVFQIPQDQTQAAVEGRNHLFSDPVLTAIAEAHGKSVAQVVLRWLVQRDVVVIPKSVRPDRMAQNLDIFDFALTDDELKQIATLDTGDSLFFDHRDPAMVSALGSRRIN